MNTTLALVTLWMLCARGRLLLSLTALVVAVIALVVALRGLAHSRAIRAGRERAERRLRGL